MFRKRNAEVKFPALGGGLQGDGHGSRQGHHFGYVNKMVWNRIVAKSTLIP